MGIFDCPLVGFFTKSPGYFSITFSTNRVFPAFLGEKTYLKKVESPFVGRLVEEMFSFPESFPA